MVTWPNLSKNYDVLNLCVFIYLWFCVVQMGYEQFEFVWLIFSCSKLDSSQSLNPNVFAKYRDPWDLRKDEKQYSLDPRLSWPFTRQRQRLGGARPICNCSKQVSSWTASSDRMIWFVSAGRYDSMGRASVQDVQNAAWVILVAERRSNPPNLMDNVTMSYVISCWSAFPGILPNTVITVNQYDSEILRIEAKSVIRTERQERNRSFPTTWTSPRHELWRRRTQKHHFPLGVEDFLIPSGFHTSGSRSFMLGDRTPGLFHVLVFPAWSWIPVRTWSVSCKKLYIWRVLWGNESTFTSPRKANKCSSSSKFFSTSVSALWIVKLKTRDMRRSTCSAVCHVAFVPWRLEVSWPDERKQTSEAGHLQRLLNHCTSVHVIICTVNREDWGPNESTEQVILILS